MDSEQKTNAEEALNIARRSLSGGDLEKAKKFCDKSLKLFPTGEARVLQKEIEARMNASKPPPSPTPRPTPTPTSSSSSTPPTQDETRTEALRIIASKGNYYEVLSITKTCTDQEIKTSYRKLALRFHPDKCTVKEGEEAMKIVNAAHECLKDPTRRKRYDMLGTEDASQLHARSGGGDREYDREHDLSTEDIINMFFNPHNRGAGPRFSTHTFRTRGAAFGGQQAGAGVAQMGFQFVHLLPFILIFVLSILAAPSSTDDQPFSLQRTDYYTVPRKTELSGVPYFVSTSFSNRYQRDPRAVAQVEAQVLKEHYRQLETKCAQEKQEHKQLLSEAKKTKGPKQQEKLDRAHNFPMPSCDNLQSFSVR